MANVTEIMQMCRLCLVKEEVNVPIFEGAGDIRQILEKIKRCLPVKVDLGDNLPKKICEGCVYKLDLCYQFYNKASQSEKQLLTWLTATDDVSVDSKARIPAAIEEIVVSPTQIVKEEPITESYENQFNNFYEGTNYRDAPETITASELSLGENEEPPVKKRKKTAAYASSSAVTDSDEDADDPIDTTITKTEDESDEEEDDENEDLDSTEAEPAFVDVSQEASTDVQPGPSGIQKPGDSQSSERIWKCKRCGDITFKTSTLLKKHRKTHVRKNDKLLKYSYQHNATLGVYYCNTCDHETPELLDIERHCEQHLEKYVCKVCNEEFQELYRYSLHAHKVHNSGERSIACGGCDFKGATSVSLLTHIKCIHLRQFKYRCEECRLPFHDVTRYREHVEWHEKGATHVCVVCSKVFPYSSNLLSHQTRYHRVFIDGALVANQCPVCRKTFAKTASLENHMRAHERPKTRPKSHLCDMCGKGFATKTKLTDHYRTHTGEKPFKCSICDKRFSISYYLTLHMRIHNGEKPYVCEFCGKCFNQGAPLKAHKRSHTGDKPFVCQICQKGFTTRVAMNAHMVKCGNKELGQV